jgi:pimeloyl-ACP methyl ester carboxylesterase
MRRLLVLLWVLAGPCLAQTSQVVDLATRPGVSLRMLVVQPAQVQSVAVLLSGGAGRLGIHANGSLHNEGNFLVRSRMAFVERGHAAILLDVPSDRQHLGGDFRESAEHAADIGAAVAWARKAFGKPVWLVGTSRGTHSVAHAALTLQGPAAPDGIVLSAVVLARGRNIGASAARPVLDMDVQQLKMPVLVVHHEQDACQVCPPALLPALMSKLPPAAKLLTYTGGRSEGPPCEAFAHHGFNGIEDRVVGDISAWMGQRP